MQNFIITLLICSVTMSVLGIFYMAVAGRALFPEGPVLCVADYHNRTHYPLPAPF